MECITFCWLCIIWLWNCICYCTCSVVMLSSYWLTNSADIIKSLVVIQLIIWSIAMAVHCSCTGCLGFIQLLLCGVSCRGVWIKSSDGCGNEEEKGHLKRHTARGRERRRGGGREIHLGAVEVEGKVTGWSSGVRLEACAGFGGFAGLTTQTQKGQCIVNLWRKDSTQWGTRCTTTENLR